VWAMERAKAKGYVTRLAVRRKLRMGVSFLDAMTVALPFVWTLDRRLLELTNGKLVLMLELKSREMVRRAIDINGTRST